MAILDSHINHLAVFTGPDISFVVSKLAQFNANSTMVVVVKDSVVDKVVSKILEATGTGMAGEGKIFVSDVDDAVDIGSKTRGESAI